MNSNSCIVYYMQEVNEEVNMQLLWLQVYGAVVMSENCTYMKEASTFCFLLFPNVFT